MKIHHYHLHHYIVILHLLYKGDYLMHHLLHHLMFHLKELQVHKQHTQLRPHHRLPLLL